MTVSLFVNGNPCTWEVQPDEMLNRSLHEHGYTSVKTGCGQGACGMCTVWLDEKPVPSCTLLTSRLANRRITTLEGVQKEAEEFSRFLVAEGADQCGFCAPGFVMLVLSLRRELTDGATEEEVKRYLTGNLCRCTGYLGKIRAVVKYLQSARQQQ